jgi:hypothetical protein
VKDGPQYFEALIDSLSSISREASDTQPYLVEMQMDGIETCNVCGNTYNMGYAQIVNPLEDLTLNMHYVALHYLAHGCARYEGSENMGILLPTMVNAAVNGNGTAHWVEIDEDTDGDGLKDVEEAYFSLDPEEYDSDGDGVPDGPALAQAMHAIIDALPVGERADSVYRINHWARGTYTCLVCGEIVNMGFIEIVNPLNGESLDYLGFHTLHFMSHGSFATDRPEVEERPDPRLIDQALGSPAYVPERPPVPQVLQVFPSPFVERTRIVCNLPAPAALKVSIHDVLGRKVMAFPPARSAKHELVWDGTDSDGHRLPPGVYFVHLDLGGADLSKKVMLLR